MTEMVTLRWAPERGAWAEVSFPEPLTRDDLSRLRDIERGLPQRIIQHDIENRLAQIDWDTLGAETYPAVDVQCGWRGGSLFGNRPVWANPGGINVGDPFIAYMLTEGVTGKSHGALGVWVLGHAGFLHTGDYTRIAVTEPADHLMSRFQEHLTWTGDDFLSERALAGDETLTRTLFDAAAARGSAALARRVTPDMKVAFSGIKRRLGQFGWAAETPHAYRPRHTRKVKVTAVDVYNTPNYKPTAIAAVIRLPRDSTVTVDAMWDHLTSEGIAAEMGLHRVEPIHVPGPNLTRFTPATQWLYVTRHPGLFDEDVRSYLGTTAQTIYDGFVGFRTA